MDITKWDGPYRVRACDWIDGKRIYYNVQYFAPGQSLAKPPCWDKTVYITDNEAGRNLINAYSNSLAEYVAGLQIRAGTEITLTL